MENELESFNILKMLSLFFSLLYQEFYYNWFFPFLLGEFTSFLQKKERENFWLDCW